jgi:endonuclease/exonuclease/phosphatase (EEP) superfamily protein YafD
MASHGLTDKERVSRWQRIRPGLARGSNVLIGAYGLGLTLFFGVRMVVGERWMLIAMINSLLPALLLPTVLLLPVSLVWRRKQLVFSLVVPIAALGVSYGIFFLPRPISAAATSSQVTILTYNVHNESKLLAPIADVIRKSNADVVALQEITGEAAQYFSTELIGLYPYQALHPNAFIGQGVISRYPLISDEYWRNDHLTVALGHQRVEIDFQGRPIILYNTHPIHPFFTKIGQPFNTELRGQEIDSVLVRAEKDNGPVLIAGDFNMNDQSEDYNRITARYHDAYREVGWGFGFTFPDFAQVNARPAILSFVWMRPVARIDYVFHSDHWQASEARVWPSSGGSDHRPVLARLALKAP